MLTVTESAKKLLKEILSAHSEEPETCVRLVLNQPGQLGLVLSKENSDDQTVQYEGTKLLVVEPELATVLEEVTLDVGDTGEESKLVMRKNS